MDIKVLGTGCASCKATIALIEQVAKATGVEVMLAKVAAQAWLPGRRSLAVLLAGAGALWVAQGLGYAA